MRSRFRARRTARRLLPPVLVAGATAVSPSVAAQGIGASPGETHTSPPTTIPVTTDEATRWRADLEQLADELDLRHANLFHTVSPEEFRRSVTDLRERIPGLARHEIIVEMMRIAASVGDGHTSVPVLFDRTAGFHALPLRLGLYEEGLFVEAADASLGDAVGGKVLAIGGVPAPEAIGRVTPLVARDNDIWLRAMVPRFLATTEILHAVGLSGDPMAATFTLEREGRRHELTVRARQEPFVLEHGPRRPTPGGWIDARDDAGGPPPLRWRNPERAYWSEYLPHTRTLYIQYDQVNDAAHGPGVRAFFENALSVADEQPLERLILDIRENSGGEGSLNVPVVKEILRRPQLDRPGGLFVIIGRKTFSAAQLLAHALDRWTEAIFVGEPTGSSPRFYGDHSFFRLGGSGLLVSAAPTWWQPGGPYDRRPYLSPRLAFEPRFEDYAANRDRAVESILRWDERRSLADLVLEPMAAGDSAAAAARVRAWSADPVNRYVLATTELNRLGYRLLHEGRSDEALAVFRLNVRLHPDYANGWDSLGEALFALGRREEGLAAYRRAFELDPAVGRAAEVLGRSGHE